MRYSFLYTRRTKIRITAFNIFLFCGGFMSAETWIQEIVSGDRQALKRLYDDYSPALYGVVSRIVKDDHIAEEVLQDAFVKIWKNAHRYDPEIAAPYTWMHTLTRRLALNAIEKADYRRRDMIQSVEKTVHTDKEPNVVLSMDHLDLNGILKELPRDLQSVIELGYLQGYTQKEIAERLSIPLGTVKSRTRIALRELRKQYSESIICALMWILYTI